MKGFLRLSVISSKLGQVQGAAGATREGNGTGPEEAIPGRGQRAQHMRKQVDEKAYTLGEGHVF